MIINSLPPAKRQKMQSYTDNVNPFLKFKMHYFLEFLDFKDLISFELVANGNIEITNRAWKILRVKYFLTADWSDCEQEDYPEKFNFVLGAITTFSCSNPKKNFDHALQLQRKYGFFLRIVIIIKKRSIEF